MKILFIYINTNSSSSSLNIGLGVASLSGYLKKFGHETFLVYFNNFDMKYLENKIETASPDVIGFYSTSSGYLKVKELSLRIRQKNYHIHQVYGGIHATLVPETIYDIETLDALCFGYGEVPLLRYMEHISSGAVPQHIPGLWIRPSLQDSTIITQSEVFFPHTHKNIDEFLKFDYELFLNEFERFTEFNRSDYKLEVIFNRSCPFKCAFCSNHNLNELYGNRIFSSSPERSIDFLKMALEQTKLSEVYIHDDCLTLNRKWYEKFITRYAEEIGAPFYCNLRVGTFNEEDVRLLKKANVLRVWVGVESGNDFIRNEVMNKKITKEQLREGFRLLHKYNITANTQNMIGVPHETPDRFIDTILLNAELKPEHSTIGIFYPYPKTKLHEICKREKYIMEDIADGHEERDKPVLKIPSFSTEEILFYYKNFNFLIEYQKKRIENPRLYFYPLNPYTSRYIVKYFRLIVLINNYLERCYFTIREFGWIALLKKIKYRILAKHVL